MSTPREDVKDVTTKQRTSGRLVVLSNRGPLRLRGDGWNRSSGGLVTALDPLLRRRKGTWVSVREQVTDNMPDLGYRQELVDLPGETKDAHYFGVSNGVLWPTMHGFPTLGEVDDAPWADYESVNRRFAEAALPHVEEAGLLWVAHYIASEVALVTPLRDGMNLVALEYIASRTLEDGSLVLSEFAGAAEYLTEVYLVNPYDDDAVCKTLRRALGAPDEERRRRMKALRARVAELDVHRWADRFLAYLEHPRGA